MSDEAPMISVNKSLKELMENDVILGEKVIVLERDF